MPEVQMMKLMTKEVFRSYLLSVLEGCSYSKCIPGGWKYKAERGGAICTSDVGVAGRDCVSGDCGAVLNPSKLP